MSPVEFAPQYTRAERIRLIARGVVIAAVVGQACHLWFLPWLGKFSASAHCRSVLGINGATVLIHGIFVGIPLLSALLVALLVGRRGYKILREGRTPPAGERVLRPTPVVRGARARLMGYVQLFAATPLLGLAVWGAWQAQSFQGTLAPAGVAIRCEATQ